MHKTYNILPLILLCGFSNMASASLLDFNNPANLGVTFSGNIIQWHNDGAGQGHLFMDQPYYNDFINFASDTYINSFEMNGKAFAGFTNSNEKFGKIEIAGLNAASQTVWSRTLDFSSPDLSAYTTWGNWLTVAVESADIRQLAFSAPYLSDPSVWFYPSIDNMVINEQSSPVPVPAAAWLFVSGLAGIFAARVRRS